MSINKLNNCHDCGAKPGKPHSVGCDVERCSVCGKQRIAGCQCEGHDPAFARWTGLWPGEAEAKALGTDLNGLYLSGLYKLFLIKPTLKGAQATFAKNKESEI